jgi:predicted regulator of Ras-like GTPase activity (Roadblock/LC7/MglB family)
MADDLQEEIKRVSAKIPGCSFVSLVGYDGISVAQHVVEANIDVNTYDAELSSLMLASREIQKNLELGAERELIWLSDNAYFIVHPVGADYFVYACLKPTGSNPGVARIELSKTKDVLRKIIYPGN